MTSVNLRTHQLLQAGRGGRLGTVTGPSESQHSHVSPTPTLLHSPLVRLQSPSLLSEVHLYQNSNWSSSHHVEPSTTMAPLDLFEGHHPQDKPWMQQYHCGAEQDKALRAALEEVHSLSRSGSFIDLTMDDTL